MVKEVWVLQTPGAASVPAPVANQSHSHIMSRAKKTDVFVVLVTGKLKPGQIDTFVSNFAPLV